MSGPDDSDDAAPRPQVFVVEAPKAPRAAERPAPQVIATEETGRIVPAPTRAPALPVDEAPRRRRFSLAKRLGVAGLVAALGGWLGVDLYLWIRAAFEDSQVLGWAAALVTATGIAAAAALLLHELRSFLRLKRVEAIQLRVETGEALAPADMLAAISDVIAAVPQDHESYAAIEAFQRKVQRHHTPAQRVELLSATVMAVLDRRGEAIVRRAGLRAFGVTAISPTAVTDALFFLALSVRMVREIASCYGHRPSALATAWLLRRLVVEAGKLGAVDFAGATLTQHLGGAIAERVATSAAESLYAAQRMARLGLVTMGLCRPIPFRQDEVPGILRSLIGKLLAEAAERR